MRFTDGCGTLLLTKRTICFQHLCYLPPRGGGVLPNMGHIGMCGPKWYGFSAILVINRVSTFSLCLFNSIFVLEEATSSSHPPSPIRALPSSTAFNAYVG